jgi:hypothetical protein
MESTDSGLLVGLVVLIVLGLYTALSVAQMATTALTFPLR